MQSLFFRLFSVMALALPLYVLLRLIFLKKTKTSFQIRREAALCLFTIFMAGLLALVFQPGPASYGQEGIGARIATRQGMNLLPFYTISGFFKAGLGPRFVINIVANILMFSPLGFFLPLLWPRWRGFFKVFLLGFAFSMTIEITQLFIGRSVDIDDVILNTLGVAFGYFVYWVFRKIQK